MKKQKINQQSLPLSVSAKFDNFRLVQSLVERLVYNKSKSNVEDLSEQIGLKSIETSSVEAYVSGDFSLAETNETVQMPFTSCFFFTCIKDEKGNHKLAWTNSLS